MEARHKSVAPNVLPRMSEVRDAIAADWRQHGRRPPPRRAASRSGERTDASKLSRGSQSGRTSALGRLEGSVANPLPISHPAGGAGKPLSSLDLMRLKIEAQIEECPKDERKTHDFLHRAKSGCGLVMSRRLVGRPSDVAQGPVVSIEGENLRVPSTPGSARARILPKVGSAGAKAASVPQSARSAGGKMPGASPRRQPEEVRKTRPIWSSAHSLERDKKALTARARMEGEAEVEFKIPDDVTWSAHMSTKPREWCDFVLDRPKRVWDWGKKLEKIHDESEARLAPASSAEISQPASQSAQILGTLAEEVVDPLHVVLGSLKTRQDVAVAEHAKRIALKAERTLMRLFASCVAPKGKSGDVGGNTVEIAMAKLNSGAFWEVGEGETETDISQLEAPLGEIDTRTAVLLLSKQGLDVFNESVSKTRAMNLLADIKGDSTNVSYAHLRATLKKVLKEGGSSFVEVLGRGPLFNEGKAIVSPAANALEEVHFRSRDTHVEAERQLLAELAQDIHNLSRVPTSGQVSSDSTYCLRGIGTTESVGLPQGLAEGRSLEPPVLKEVQRILEEIGESIEEGKAVDAKARARLAHLDKELGQELKTACSVLEETAQDQPSRNRMSQAENTPASITPASKRAGLTPMKDGSHVLPEMEKVRTPQGSFSRRNVQVGHEGPDAAIRDKSSVYSLEVNDTREKIRKSIHSVRLTKGRCKALKDRTEELDMGDLYFTDSESEEEQTETRESISKSQIAELQQKARQKMMTELELLQSDETDVRMDEKALALIEAVCNECGVQSDSAFVAKMLRSAESPWATVQHDIISTLKAGRHQQTMSVLIKALDQTSEHDSVMALMRYLLRELRRLAPVPSRDPAWAFRLAAQPDLWVPKRLLTLQPAVFGYKYRNDAAEKAAAAAAASERQNKAPIQRAASSQQRPGSIAETYPPPRAFHPILGWHGVPMQQPEEREQHAIGNGDLEWHPRLQDPAAPGGSAPGYPKRPHSISELNAKGYVDPFHGLLPPRLPTAERTKAATTYSPKKTAAIAQELAKQEVAGGGEEGATGEEGPPKTPPPSQAQELVEEIKMEVAELREDQTRRKEEVKLYDEWQFHRSATSLEAEMQRRREPALALIQHPIGDWVGICRVRSEPGELGDTTSTQVTMDSMTASSVTQELAQELKAIHRKAEYVQAQDVFVGLISVPLENEGFIQLVRGIHMPGNYVLKYFTSSSPLPLSVSDVFSVVFPEIMISAPERVEVGHSFKVTFALSNFDFDHAAETGNYPPLMSGKDSVSIFAVGEKGEDLDCVWSESVVEWTRTTDLTISTFKPPAPGKYRIKYQLGLHDMHVAGQTVFSIKFQRKATNRFWRSDTGSLSMDQTREARVFLSLIPIDMDLEVKILMEQVAFQVQAAIEDSEITFTFVCPNYRHSDEVMAFERGICTAIRSSLREIDTCRPLFVSLLGERYGLVPTLTSQDSDSIQMLHEDFPWLKKSKNPFVNTALGCSMLEIEHLYSVLMDEPESALVYARDLNYIYHHLPVDKRANYLQTGCGEMNTSSARSAMSDLKMRLRAVPELKLASPQEDRTYDHPSDLAQVLTRDLVKIVRESFSRCLTPSAEEKNRIMAAVLCDAHFMQMSPEIWSELALQIDVALQSHTCRIVMIPAGAGTGKTSACAHWIRTHLRKYKQTDTTIDTLPQLLPIDATILPKGPRSDLAPHLLVCSFVSHLQDPSIDAVLRQLYSDIKVLTKSSRRLPVEGQCIDEFKAFMSDAAAHGGLIWVVDNINLVVGVTDWQFLHHGLATVGVLVASCEGRQSELMQAFEGSQISELLIPPIDAGDTWALQQHYCTAYGTAPDDEFIWKIVASEQDTEVEGAVAERCVRSVSHVRIALMTHRLIHEEGLPMTASGLEQIIRAADGATAFVLLMQALQAWQPLMTQLLMMLAWSHRGLREMELLQLLPTLNHATLRAFKDMILDEMLMPVFGVYDYMSPSLKLAFRHSMLAKDSRQQWPLALPALQAMMTFFLDHEKCSLHRRVVECPMIFCSDPSNERLLDFLTNSEHSSMLVASGQVHLTPRFLAKMQITLEQYVGFVLDDFQRRFGSRVSNLDSPSSQSKDFKPEKSMRKVFETFAVQKQQIDQAKGSKKIAFATRNEVQHTMTCANFLNALSYLELMDNTEERNISTARASEIFTHISGSDNSAEISYMEFRHALVTVAKELDIQLIDMLKKGVGIAQLHRLFNFYAAGKGEVAAGTGALGERSRTLDMREFVELLDLLGLSQMLSKSEMLQYFQETKQASSNDDIQVTSVDESLRKMIVPHALPAGHGDEQNESLADLADESVGELDYKEFKFCLQLICQAKSSDLDHLVGKVLQQHFEKDSLTESSATFAIEIENMTEEQRQQFTSQAASIATLFCELGAFEGSIDIAELLLRSCYGIENMQDIGNPGAAPVHGTRWNDTIIEALATYARCTFLQAEVLLVKIRALNDEHAARERELASVKEKEKQRRKEVASQRQTSDLKREERENKALFEKRVGKIAQDIDASLSSIHDTTNQLRWIRRRASTAGEAAKNLLDRQTNLSHDRDTEQGTVSPTKSAKSSRSLTRLHSCLDVFSSDPDSRWGSFRLQVKEATKNPLDADDSRCIHMAMPVPIDLKQLLHSWKGDVTSSSGHKDSFLKRVLSQGAGQAAAR